MKTFKMGLSVLSFWLVLGVVWWNIMTSIMKINQPFMYTSPFLLHAAAVVSCAISSIIALLIGCVKWSESVTFSKASWARMTSYMLITKLSTTFYIPAALALWVTMAVASLIDELAYLLSGGKITRVKLLAKATAFDQWCQDGSEKVDDFISLHFLGFVP
jgi:hypothetical protein